MNNNYKSVLDLISDIYESSLKPAHWSAVMEKLAVMTRSKSAVLVIHDNEVKQLSFMHAHGVPKLALALLNSPMGALDPGLNVMRDKPAGTAMNMYRLDDKETVPGVVYGMISRLTDLFYFGGVNCFNDESWHVGIGLHRNRQEGEFEPEVLELLEDLVPHFQRALRIQKEFTRLQLQQQALQAELDRHILGLILLGENGELLYTNPMAERTLKNHGAIELRNDSLCAYRKNENVLLQQVIQQASNTSPNSVSQGQALGLSHPEHAVPLALLVVPANQSTENGVRKSHSRVAIYITDPEAPIPLAHDALMAIYGMSEREAKVAVAIANGREVNQIAEMHHVSVQTVRSQIKSIFSKTGVNRQADLIRLLLGIPMRYET